MGAISTAVRPFAGGVACRAAPVSSDATGRASGKKRRRLAPPSRDSSVCVEKFYVPSQKRKMTHCRNNVKTDAGADAKMLTVGGETPINPARELLHERLAAELEALHRILKKAEHISRGARDSEQITAMSAQQPSEPASGTARSTAQAESVSGESVGGPATLTAAAPEAAQSGEAKNVEVQDVQRAAPKPVVSMAGLIYRAKIRLELVAMEKTVLPDESIHPRDLQRFCIAEYGHPSLMRQLGLFLKADAA